MADCLLNVDTLSPKPDDESDARAGGRGGTSARLPIHLASWSRRNALGIGIPTETPLERGTEWTCSGWSVLFKFNSYPGRLGPTQYVGPETAAAPRVQTGAGRNKKRMSIFSRRFPKPEDSDGARRKDHEARFGARWKEFTARHLHALVVPIQEADRSFGATLAGRGDASLATSEFTSEAVPDR